MIATVALAALAAACAACGPTSPEEGQAELSFEPLLHQTASGLGERLREVIRDQATWAAIWGRIHEPVAPQPPLPPVDFSRHMLIVAAAGTRPSGGFGITVRSVALRDGKVEVSVVESCPAPGAMVITVLTQPVEVVRLDRRAESAFFLDAKAPSCR